METVRLDHTTPAASAPTHRAGRSVDTNDQLSSVTLLGIATSGAVVSSLLLHLVGG